MTTTRELAEGQLYGSLEWPVDEDYQIEGELVRPISGGSPVKVGDQNRKITTRYEPILRTELPGEFAKVSDGSHTAILDFIRRYGLLGYQQVYQTSLELHKVLRAGDRIYGAIGKQNPCVAAFLPEDPDALFVWKDRDPGEPIPWIVEHARAVKLVLDLRSAWGNNEKLRNVFLQYEWPTPPAHLRPEDRIIRVPMVARAFAFTLGTDWLVTPLKPHDLAARIIRSILNENLDGVRRLVETEGSVNKCSRKPLLDNDSFKSIFKPESLLDAIYWILADAVTNSWVRRCAFKSCGRAFVASSQKYKFCPPPRGFDGSSCANRDRQRRYRKRKKAKDRAI